MSCTEGAADEEKDEERAESVAAAAANAFKRLEAEDAEAAEEENAAEGELVRPARENAVLSDQSKLPRQKSKTRLDASQAAGQMQKSTRQLHDQIEEQ